MGLFNDTLRDARRPIAGAWVRRAVDDAAESPGEDFPQDDVSSGMETVFRFQKVESPVSAGALRGVSFQAGAGNQRVPSGDPLSAGGEAEGLSPSANKVKGNDDSIQGDSRGSELATGHEIRIGPGKVAAAVINPESSTLRSVVQSEVLPGPPELGYVQHAAFQSEIPDGSRNSVSRQSETFLSRRPGRGTPPSETPLYPDQAATTASHPAFVVGPDAGAPATDAPLPVEAGAPGAIPWPGVADAGAAVPAQEFAAAPTREPRRPSGREPRPALAPAAEPTPPSLVIGRIDVLVVADAAPAQASAPARTDRGFLSRNYLKRL